MKIGSIRVAAALLGICLAISGCDLSDSPAVAQEDGPGATGPGSGAVVVDPSETSTLPVTTPVAVPPVSPVVPTVPPVVGTPAQPVTGSATLSWVPPTANEDGTGLTNLAGYKIYFGSNPDSLMQSVQITNPGMTTYVMANLAAGTTYFAMTAYTTTGAESARSVIGSKTI